MCVLGAVLVSGCAPGLHAGGEIAGVCQPRTAPPAGGADSAWPLSSMGLNDSEALTGEGVTVAVIDSGLVAGVVPADRVLAASVSLIDAAPLEDDEGHGTHMAELVHLVAPAADILAIKAMDRSGSGRLETIADAVRYADLNGADVISLSIESPTADDELRSALEQAASGGAIVVIAAGNEQLDLDRFARYPASLRIDGGLVVAATDPDGRLTASTNWGDDTVDLGAPGAAVPVTRVDGGAGMISGSSPAAALVAGAVALLRERSTEGIAGALIATAQREPTARSGGSTRRIDVGAASACLDAEE